MYALSLSFPKRLMFFNKLIASVSSKKKKAAFLLLFFLSSSFCHLFGQLNMQQLGYMNIPSIKGAKLNDIWGYVDGMGNEYAIVGLYNGVVIVDVTDPANPVEVFFESGSNSSWRDIKTWGTYAYVTTEAKDGLLIIDLSTLPGNTNLNTSLYIGPSGNRWRSAHNLFIDENGVCYIFGANRDNGGCIMLDLTQNPMNPTELGTYETYYIHDGVVRGDTLYAAHIQDGICTVVDVSDKQNPSILGVFNTPGLFSHNIWMSDDGDYVYTTDEISGGYLGEFNISDLSDINETDRIQSNPGSGSAPHNAHFINDFIVTSYYRDGVVVHDVSDKGNMVLVGEFDTSPLLSGEGFNGCWGVYPWLPSGNIIASDVDGGLYILSCTYERGAYLHGTVTDITNGNPINNARIEIINSTVSENSRLTGEYKTGIAVPGTYDIAYSHPTYIADTLFGVTLTAGNITIQHAQLQPKTPTTLHVHVEDMTTNLPIPNALVQLVNYQGDWTLTTDASGNASVAVFYEDFTDIYAGKWGYITYCDYQALTGSPVNLTIQLQEGYYDDFHFDFGWTTGGSAPAGNWERAEPIGINFNSNPITPSNDIPNDCGTKCYVTGNSETSPGSDDVDIGDVILESPVFDLSGYNFPQLSFYRWWANVGGNGSPNDSLQIFVDNGITTVRILLATAQDTNQGKWKLEVFDLAQHIALTSTMKLIVKTADWQTFGGHIVEAGIDVFKITESAVGLQEQHKISVKLYPQPSDGNFYLSGVPSGYYLMTIVDLTGRICFSSHLSINSPSVNFNLSLAAGAYILTLKNEERATVIGEKLIIRR